MRTLCGAALASTLVISVVSAQETIHRYAIFRPSITVDGVSVELARDQLFIGAWNIDEGFIDNGEWHSLGDRFWRDFEGDPLEVINMLPLTDWGVSSLSLIPQQTVNNPNFPPDSVRISATMLADAAILRTSIDTAWGGGSETLTLVRYPDVWDEPFTTNGVVQAGPWHWPGIVLVDERIPCLAGDECLVPDRHYRVSLESFGWGGSRYIVDQLDLDYVLINWGNVISGNRIEQTELDEVLINWGAVYRPPDFSMGAAPEPSTLGLLVIGLAAAGALRGRLIGRR